MGQGGYYICIHKEVMINFNQTRLVLRRYYDQGLKPVNGRKPIPDEVTIKMVDDLTKHIDKDGVIGVLDTFLILTSHLRERGFKNIVVLESDHTNLTDAQDQYYNNIKKLCDKFGVTYYVPPFNNYNRQ